MIEFEPKYIAAILMTLATVVVFYVFRKKPVSPKK